MGARQIGLGMTESRLRGEKLRAAQQQSDFTGLLAVTGWTSFPKLILRITLSMDDKITIFLIDM